ncbi:hypothetical protein QQG74_09185 [Micromonospora sp. FIMYZ51]|uniref:hypothetical protein n=1 Tax=Micromonospora sp. FIMYZ51 TaxID=3051832 RepID=UPI00311FF15F
MTAVPYSDTDVSVLADLIGRHRDGLGNTPLALARAILEAGYRRTVVSPSGEPVCQHCHPAPPTFRCRELGHVIHPN